MVKAAKPSRNGHKSSSNGRMNANERKTFFQFLTRAVMNQQFSRAAMARSMAEADGHQVDDACGYPKELGYEHYKWLYDREGIATRVVSMLPSECWSVKPQVYETEDVDGDAQTPFEKAFKKMMDNTDLLSKLNKFDEIAGLGRYGVLFIGTGKNPEIPFPNIGPNGETTGDPPAIGSHYLMPFAEGDAKIIDWEKNKSSIRYGKPLYYDLTISDPTTGLQVGKPQKVHWTHCIHACEGTVSDVIGASRLHNVFNYILNIRKVMGGSAEMFWLGGFPGTSFEVPPELAEQVELDKAELEAEIQQYMMGFKRYLALKGIHANQLQPNIADPDTHVRVQLMAIAIAKEVPLRMLMGTEEARLASMQDSETWNRKIHRRHDIQCTPKILRPTTDRFLQMGILPPIEKEEYKVRWPDVYSVSAKDKADITGKLVRALAEYTKSGAYKAFPPQQLYTMIMDLSIEQAEEVIMAAQEVAASGEFDFLEPPMPATKGPATPGSRPPRRPPLGATRKVKISGLQELIVNPTMRCQRDGKPGYKYGESGKCYTYEAGDKASQKRALRKARAQGAAIEISKHLRNMEEEDEKGKVAAG